MRIEDVIELFPILKEIADDNLRIKCAQTLQQGINENGWTGEKIKKCPVDMDDPNNPGNCLDHFQDVAACALMVYDYMKAKYGDIVGSNRDYIIASALLHDNGKLYEYNVTDEGPSYNKDLSPVRHPLQGAMVAHEHGIPNEILHAIASHNFEGDHAKPTLEYHYVRLMDALVFYSLIFKGEN